MATIATAYYVPTLLGLSSTLGISCAISAGCILGFEICRRLEFMQCLFAPRTWLLVRPSAPLPKRPFAWLSTFWLDEDYYLVNVGLDATMYLRFLRMTVQFLTLQALIICPILLSLHWTEGFSNRPWRIETPTLPSSPPTATTPSLWPTPSISNNSLSAWDPAAWNISLTDEFRSNSTLYYLSIANVPNRSPIVWVHVLFTFFISLSWLWLLFVNHWHHLHLQQATSRQSASSIHERTILVTNVPHSMRKEEAMSHHFVTHMSAQVESVTVVRRPVNARLQQALVTREKRLDQIEMRLIALARSLPHLRQRDAWLQLAQRLDHVGTAYSDVSRLFHDLFKLDTEIEQLRSNADYLIPTGSAFVTFASSHSAQICAQLVTSWRPGVFDTRLAPEPRDVMWRGLFRHGRKGRIIGWTRTWVVIVAVWSLTIFWLFPISFILGLTSIESLSQHFGFLRYFLDTPTIVRSFIQNILPTLLVTLFMSLLPWVLLEISKQQDAVSYSELEDLVLGRYYHFAIFNVLIVFLLGTTFLSTMLDVLYEPAKLIQLLAISLPQGANFFLNYILFNSCTHAMELFQLGSQLFGHLFVTLPWISRTPRILSRFTSPWAFPYYYYYPNHILVLVITLTYSVIQPLILIFSLFYFSAALICYKHQFAYCYVRRYESGGSRHYRRMARYTSDGLIIFQFTMMGLLYLKGDLVEATSLISLIVITVWSKIQLTRLFGRRAKHPFLSRLTSHLETKRPLDKIPIQSPKTLRKLFRRQRAWWKPFDDVWKLSYVHTWWQQGRYATQGNDEEEDIPSDSCCSSNISTHIETIPSPATCSPTGLPRLNLSMIVDSYQDDSKSVNDTYVHAMISQRLEKHLLLPIDPHQKRWDLKHCIRIPLHDLAASFRRRQ